MRTMVCFNYLKSERCHKAIISGQEKYGFHFVYTFLVNDENHCNFAN